MKLQYETGNPVQNAVNKFKNHHTIKKAISKVDPNKIFSLCAVLHGEILKQIKSFATE